MYLLAVSILLMSGIAATLLLTARSGSAAVTLPGVSANDLESQGLTVTESASDYLPVISKDKAIESAGFTGIPVIDTRLVHLTKDPNHVGPNIKVDTYVWAVLLDPSAFGSNGPAGSAARKANYAVAFVDANTGEFLFGISAGTN
jgi:hypothetical protein